MNKVMIAKRQSALDDFKSFVELKIGMGITSRINGDFKIIDTSLPYPDFAYIVTKIDSHTIYVDDTQNNNSWTISINDLNKLELIRDFHNQNHSIDFDKLNDVLE